MSSKIKYAKLTEYLDFKSRKIKFPFTGTFELTPRCNMNCKMCYIRMTEEEMNRVGKELTVDEWIAIAKEAVDAGMTMLLLTGGEAILYKDFKKLYLELRKLGLFISINSNGTMLTDEWIEFFKKYPPAKFNITIYGGCNESYARLCKNPKGFDQLKANIEKLQAAGLEILLNCMITKQNVFDMDKIYQFGKEHNLPIHANTYSFPAVRKEGVINNDQDRFTPTEAAIARIRVNWNAIDNKDRFINRAVNILSDVEKFSTPEEDCGQIIGDKVLCAAGKSAFWITWDGRMLPCGMMPDFSVSLHEKNFTEAWQDITEFVDKIYLASDCKKCSKKKMCLPCAAKLKAESGSFDKKAEYKCEYTSEYLRLLAESLKVLK